jgi:hypothetical protein
MKSEIKQNKYLVVPKAALMFMLSIATIITLSLIREKSETMGNIISWIFFIILILIILINFRKNKTSDFFKKNKKLIVISLVVSCILDEISTYFFIKDDLNSELSILQRTAIILFGLYPGLFIMFVISSFCLIFLVKKATNGFAKPFFFAFILMKLFAVFINFSSLA